MTIFGKIKSKFSFYKEKYYLKKFFSIEEKDYEFEQRKLLARWLNYARIHVPYYSKLIKWEKIDATNSLDVLKKLPLLDKKIILDQGEKIHSRRVTNKWKSWHNTGGSTGNPLRFPIGGYRWHYNSEICCQAYLYKLMCGSYSIKISSVDGRRVEPELLDKHIYWGTNNSYFPYGKTHYSTIYLSKETFSYYIDHINKEKPDVMRGYPSGFYQLAQFMERGLGKIVFELKGIYLTSEDILDYQIELIKKHFKCPIWGQYGHSEASVFAIRYPECEEYYCHPLYGYTEIIGGDGLHVKEGEIGEVVVTGFNYTALPFIRYRTGDLAEYGGKKDGVVILRKLMGRSSDFIVNSRGEKIYLVGLIFGGHLEAFNCIESWQFTQEKLGELSVKIVTTALYTKEIEVELYEFFRNYHFVLRIEYVNSLPKTQRGKQKFLIQKLYS